MHRPGTELATFRSRVRRPTTTLTEQPNSPYTKTTQKEGNVFYHVYKRFFLFFFYKKRFLNVFFLIFFRNVYCTIYYTTTMSATESGVLLGKVWVHAPDFVRER